MTIATEWTFKAYLRKRKITDSPQGDFTKDALADPSFPDSVRWSDVLGFLVAKQAIPEAVVAGRSVFQQYLRGSRLRFGRSTSREG